MKHKIDVAIGFFAQLLQLANGLILLPVILAKFDSQLLSVWYIFQSVNLLAYKLNFGFQPTIIRNTAYIFAGATTLSSSGFENNSNNETVNYDLYSRLINGSKKLYLSVGLIALVFLFISTFYINTFILDFSRKDYFGILISWLVFSFSTFIEIIFSYYPALLEGSGKIRYSYLITILQKTIFIIVCVILVWQNYGLIAIALSKLVSVLVSRIFYKLILFDNNLKNNYFKKTKNDKDIIKILWPNSWKSGLISLCEYLITNFSLIVGANFFSLSVVARYGLTFQLISFVAPFSISTFNSLLPSIIQSHFKKEKYEVKKYFIISILTCFIIYFISYMGIIFVLPDILELINSNTSPLGNDFIFILFLSYFLYTICLCYYRLLSVTNDLSYYRSFLINCIISVLLEFLLLLIFKNVLIMLSSIIFSVGYSFISGNIFHIHKKFKFGFMLWRKNEID